LFRSDIAGDVGTEDAIVRVAEQVPVLIVTLGSVGALVVTGNERRQVPAFDVTAVDTTGAGDTFCGVLAARLAASRPADGGVPAIEAVADAAGAASAAAALAVGTAGAPDPVPTAEAVTDLLPGSTTGREQRARSVLRLSRSWLRTRRCGGVCSRTARRPQP